MTTVEWGFLAVAVIVVPLLARWVWRSCAGLHEDAWRPQELRDAEIVYAEQVFRSSGPASIIAKLDRAYRRRNGLIILVELKTRQVNRVYLSDIIELSVQRFALAAQTKEVVAEYGYVLIQQDGHRAKQIHQVPLWADAEVTRLVAHREAILSGATAARYTGWPRLCRHCTFQQECKPPAYLGHL